VATTNTAAGTPCDADSSVCTVDDACDGAGQCAAGALMDCQPPCGICDAIDGCVYPASRVCDAGVSSASLSIQLADDPADNRLSLKLLDDVSAAALGDPTASTAYTMCIYSSYGTGGITRPLFSATIPAAGTCDGRDCWTAKSSGYSYKDRFGSTDGITGMKAGPKGFRLSGRGAGLPLPDELGLAPNRIGAGIVRDDGVTQTCWFHWLQASSQETAEYKGKYRP
jgi:hypothetical protein